MKEAAGYLGISYNMLYLKYRDAYGKISDKSKSMIQKSSDSENDDDAHSIDGEPDYQEDDVVSKSFVTRSGRRTRRCVEVRDPDYDAEQSSAEDDETEHDAPIKPFPCKVPGCSKSYADSAGCRKHVIRVHGAENYDKYQRLRGGPRKVTKMRTLSDKVNAKNMDTPDHNGGKELITCQFPGCTKTFTERASYYSHKYYHKMRLKASANVSQPFSGKDADDLLAKEKDPEVVELQKKFSAQEVLWRPKETKRKVSNGLKDPIPKKRKHFDDPDWTTQNEDQLQDSEYSNSEDELNVLSSKLRQFVMENNCKRIKVRRAGANFNLSPVKYKNQWIDMIKYGKKPCFATILGVKRIPEEGIDPRIMKYNGELLAACPLAWSFPRSEDELNSQYDAVMDAYRKVLGMSEEELHCTFIFLHAQYGMGVCTKEFRKQGYRKKNPKRLVKNKLSQQLQNMSKDQLLKELEKRTEEFPADTRTEIEASLGLMYDRCRIQMEQTLKPDDFEGLMLVAWHDDGEPIGKVLNFDEDMSAYIAVIRDVWMELSNRGSYVPPFSEHLTTCFKSVFERAFAPRLIQKLIDGTAPSRMCPTCGKVFVMIDALRDGRKFQKHIERWHKSHKLECSCEGVDKLDRFERVKHKKLHHSDGKYVQCSFPKCSKVISKTSMDEHNKNHHLTNIFCELCGKTFDDKKQYDYHYSSRHTEIECKVCKEKVLRINEKSHMISHRGDPIP